MTGRAANPPVWWLHPVVALGVPSGIWLLAAWATPELTYEQQWHTWKFITTKYTLIGAASILAFCVGAWLSSRVTTVREPAADWKERIAPAGLRLFHASFVLTVIGYAVWLAAAVSRGMRWPLVLAVLRGDGEASYQMKQDYLVTVSGLSTLTQMGIAAVILACLISPAIGWKPMRLELAVLAVLTVLRVFLNSERLAALELIVPGIVILLQVWRDAFAGGWRRTMLRAAPVIAPLLLLLVFTVTERNRSWAGYYSKRSDSLTEFASLRLAGYYITAFNNSCYLMNQFEEPLETPYFTLNFLFKFPIVKDLFEWLMPREGQKGPAEYPRDETFHNGANAEFNNTGGLLLPHMDYGWPFGILYWALAGTACGVLYQLFAHNQALGLFVYPIVFLSLLETTRLLYWSAGKVVPPMIMLAFAAWQLNRIMWPRHHAAVAERALA